MFNYPQLVTTKSLNPPTINRKEWTKVTVSVYGDTRAQTSKVPISMAMVLDYTESMQVNNAYQSVSAAAKMVLGQLTASTDYIGIITIHNPSVVAVPLTSNFVGLAQQIDGFAPQGWTDLKGAFDQANAMLAQATSPSKAVLFMSDGLPTDPNIGLDWQQINYISTHWQNAAAHGIRYYTVGYGDPINEMLLQFLADKTGGTYQNVPTPQGLQAVFTHALQAATSTLSTAHVVISEVVAKNLTIRPNSLAKSLTSVIDDPVKFDADFQAAEQVFYQTRALKVPEITALGANQMFSISFDVTSDVCGPKALMIAVDDLTASPPAGQPASNVQYECGQPAPVVVPLTQATLQVNPCGVRLDKEFDEQALTVTLKLSNDYEHAIRHVRLIENPSAYFALLPPAVPQATGLTEKAAQWLLDQIESKGERIFKVQLVDSQQQAHASPPYPVDGPDTGLSFNVEDFQLEILIQDTIYPTFQNDLQQLNVSPGTIAFLKNYPDPNYQFEVQQGQNQISASTPDPDFSWAIHAWIVHTSGTPSAVAWKEPVELFVKQTPTGFSIYRTVFKAVRPQQRWTSASYHSP